MNPENIENLEKSQSAQVEPPKRSYKPRDKKAPTISSFNEQIQKRKLQQEILQAEIDDLTVKRNHLFVVESELMGLLDILADPKRAEWLARKVEESNAGRN